MKSKHRLNANDDDHQKARMSRVANTNLRNRNIVDTVDKYAAKVSSPDGVLNDIMIEKTIFSVGSGLPPMKYTDYSEMVDKVKHAFPNWICTVGSPFMYVSINCFALMSEPPRSCTDGSDGVQEGWYRALQDAA